MVAPEIFGMEDVKKALLLILVGGVHQASDGMLFRCIFVVYFMGDLGVRSTKLPYFSVEA